MVSWWQGKAGRMRCMYKLESRMCRRGTCVRLWYLGSCRRRRQSDRKGWATGMVLSVNHWAVDDAFAESIRATTQSCDGGCDDLLALSDERDVVAAGMAGVVVSLFSCLQTESKKGGIWPSERQDDHDVHRTRLAGVGGKQMPHDHHDAALGEVPNVIVRAATIPKQVQVQVLTMCSCPTHGRWVLGRQVPPSLSLSFLGPMRLPACLLVCPIATLVALRLVRIELVQLQQRHMHLITYLPTRIDIIYPYIHECYVVSVRGCAAGRAGCILVDAARALQKLTRRTRRGHDNSPKQQHSRPSGKVV
ncbi:hypothetical protein CGRA01v4_10785 [Colletotrichum graminicola]|nr:hypothetical protein CGRA01v4_10785 [Colletotrichum graminicola]